MLNFCFRDDDSRWLIAVCLRFNWKFVNVITDAYLGISPLFYSLANQQNISIVNNIIVETGSSSYVPQLEIIKNSGVSVILTNLYDNHFPDSETLIRDANTLGMFSEDYNWAMVQTDEFLFNYTSDGNQIFPPLVNTQGIIAQSSPYTLFYNQDLGQRIVDVWTPEFCESLNVSFNDTFPPISISNSLNSGYLDAIWTIFLGLNSYIYKQQLDFPLDGVILYELMRQQNFSGFEGQVFYDANGDFPLTMYTVAVYDDSGNLTVIANLSRGDLSSNYYEWIDLAGVTPIVWSSNTTTVPNSAMCGRSCGNGTCIRPFQCHCNFGYTRDQNLFQVDPLHGADCTLPICNNSCVHGICM